MTKLADAIRVSAHNLMQAQAGIPQLATVVGTHPLALKLTQSGITIQDGELVYSNSIDPTLLQIGATVMVSSAHRDGSLIWMMLDGTGKDDGGSPGSGGVGWIDGGFPASDYSAVTPLDGGGV